MKNHILGIDTMVSGRLREGIASLNWISPAYRAIPCVFGLFALLCLAATAQASVEIVDQSVSTASARDGQTITLEYRIQSDSARDAWLGAVLVAPDGATIDDPSHEHLIDDRIGLQSGTHWYEREFFINLPPDAATGDYGIEWEVHWGSDGFTSTRRNNVLNIQEPVPVQVSILMYHKVGDTAHSRFWVTGERLESHIRALLEKGYTPVTFQDVAEYRAGVSTAPSKPVVITFDDGYQDLVTHVLPIISKSDLRVPVTAFVNPDLFGRTNSWDQNIDFSEEPEVKHITWSEARQLHDSGLVDIQSHGSTHVNMVTVDQEERMRELTASRRDLENELGKVIRFFAYPWGGGAEHDQVHRDLHRAGYFMAAGIDTAPETATREKYALHRHDIHWEVTADDNGDTEDYLFGPSFLGASGESYHPADINQDWEIASGELTGYASAWLGGHHNDAGFLTGAAQIWLNGGRYQFNPGGSGATQWRAH